MGNVNKFSERAYEIQMWGEIYNILQDRERDEHTEWGVTGKSETEQAKNYATGELLWEDDEHTIPVMRDTYGVVEIADEDLSDERQMHIRVLKRLMVAVEKMA